MPAQENILSPQNNKQFKPILTAFVLVLIIFAIGTVVELLGGVFKIPRMFLEAAKIATFFMVAQLYGLRMERQKPGVLTSGNIKKLAIAYTCINIILVPSSFILIWINKFHGKLDLALGIGLGIFIVFWSFFSYFGMKIFVNSGVKQRQNQLLKKN